MKPTKQTVYIPVKVEDELPDSGSWVVCDNSEELLYSHNYGWMYNANEIVPKDKQPKFWLKPQEGYFFAPKQFNQLLSEVIKQSLETGGEECKIKREETHEIVFKGFSGGNPNYGNKEIITCDKQSITNTFETIFNKFKV